MPSTSQLNIKNPEARRLATELCEMTGETVTEAVTAALRERLERKKSLRTKEGVAEKLLEMGRFLRRNAIRQQCLLAYRFDNIAIHFLNLHPH